jgi:hypothetical protein
MLKRFARLVAATGAAALTQMAAAQTQTAQSVMVALEFNATAYEIVGTRVYTFDRDCAETYYTNAWDGNPPTVTCTGGGTGGCVTAPPTPPAPAPDANRLMQHAQAQRCVFFCGGALGSSTYTQTVTVNVGSPAPQAQRGSWKFTYTYNITPNQATVDGGTCWTCEDEVTGVDVEFGGFVSSESYIKKRTRTEGWSTKYSFTLRDQLGNSRVINGLATLQWYSPILSDWVDVAFQALDTSTIEECANYEYYGNAGVNGNPGVLNQLHAPGGRPATMVSDILLEDDFAQNNGALCDYSHRTPYDGVFGGIVMPGDYRVVITGTVKGNPGSANFPFSVTSSIVSIGGCTGCPPPDCP